MAGSNTEGRLEYEVHVNITSATQNLNKLMEYFTDLDGITKDLSAAIKNLQGKYGNLSKTLNGTGESAKRVKTEIQKSLDEINTDKANVSLNNFAQSVHNVANAMTPIQLAVGTFIDQFNQFGQIKENINMVTSSLSVLKSMFDRMKGGTLLLPEVSSSAKRPSPQNTGSTSSKQMIDVDPNSVWEKTNTILNEVPSKVEEVTNKTGEATEEATKFKGAIEGIKDVVNSVSGQPFANIKNQFFDIQDAIALTKQQLAEAFENNEIDAKINALALRLEALAKRAEGLKSSLTGTDTLLEYTGRAYDLGGWAERDPVKSAKESAKVFEAAFKASPDGTLESGTRVLQQQEEQKRKQEEQKRLAEEKKKKEEDYAKAVKQAKEAQAQLTEETKKNAGAVSDALGLLGEINPALKGIASVGQETCAVLQRAIEGLEDSTVILGIIRVCWQAIQAKVSFYKGILDGILSILQAIGQVMLGLASTTVKVYGYVGKIVATIVGASMVAPVKSLFDFVSNSISSIYKKVTKFIAALQRIALYRMIRFLMKQITQAVSGALENIYQYSLKVSNDLSDAFRTTMDNIASDFLYMKNSIASVLAPAIEILEPLLRQIINAFVEFANKVAQVVATLNGQTSFLKAKRIMTQYAEEANQATEANNELKKSFAGLDEITVIGQNDSDSSSDKDKNELDYGSMFEVAEIDSQFAEIGKHIKELWDEMIEGFNNGDLTSFGTHLAEDINGFVKSIDEALNWKYVGEKVTRFVSTIASGFNALVDPSTGIDFTYIGETLGGIANTIINTLYLIFTKFDWANLFRGLANVINGFASELDPQAVADTITAFITTVFDSLTAFIDELEIPDIMGKIVEVLTNIDYGEILMSMSNYAISIINALGEAFEDPEMFTTAIMNFTYGLKKAILNIALHAEELSESLSNIAVTLITSFATIIGSMDWKIVGETIMKVLGGLNWKELSSSIVSAASAIVDALIGFLEGLTSNPEEWNNFITGISDTLTGLADEVDWDGLWDAIVPLVQALFPLIEPLLQKILPRVFAALTWVFKQLAPIILPYVLTFIGIVAETLIDGLKEKLTEGWKNIASNVLHGILSVCQRVVNFFIDLLNEGIIDKINAVLDAFNAIMHTEWHVGRIPSVDFNGTGHTVGSFANGGFPEDGLFMANHGELVGKFSNGKTAVANNEQIVDGIARGVASANDEQNSLLRTEIEVLKQILAKDSSINVNTITRGLQEQNRRAGRSVVGVY